MDKLSNDERILAWNASWNPSFAGIAIINQDFTFRSANPQFCKLLGVSPADLIMQRFQDVTHPESRRISEENAKLLMQGLIDFYILSKRFLFSNGHQVSVIMMVTRVPASADGVFQFFLCRIMLDENGGLYIKPKPEQGSAPSCPTRMQMAVEFFGKHYKGFIGAGLMIGAIITALIKQIQDGG